MKSIASLLLGLAFAITASAASKPNIVFIMADDLGFADVGFHGGNAPTPVLDKLAREGLELTQSYSAPVCSPTRSALMTGRCWSRFNVTTPQNPRALPWDTVTLPRALKIAGYDTCLTGKWHLGSKPKEGPNHFGFDHSYGSLAGGVSPWNHSYKQGPFAQTWHRNEKLLDEEGHVTDLITNEAVQWIESRTDKPFFLYMPYTAVHLPIKEPEEWVKRVPASIQGDVARHYAACVMHLDDSIGRVLAALEKKGVRDNTIVVFTSDNGGSWAENNDLHYPDDHCPNGKLTANNTPWRGQKGELYEGGVRVPCVVSWPGRVKPGKVESAVQIIDWMPTLTALAGWKSDTDLKWDGTDLSTLLLEHKPLPDRTLYAVSPNWRGRSVRYANWKLIITEDKKGSTSELYDLAADPAESKNLADSQPAQLAQMMERLKQISARDKDAVAKDDK